MKKLPLLSFLLFFILGLSFTQAQTLINESFDSNQFLPTGWSAIGTAPNWGRVTTMNQPIVGGPHSGAGMARFRYPTNGTGASNTETIATPSFDLSGRGNNPATFSFWIYRDSLIPANYDTLSIYVNTTANLNGAELIGNIARNRSLATPDTQTVNGWYQYTLNIPVAYTGSSNYILLKGTCYGPGNSSRRIYIDDLEWTAFPPACTGTPNGGLLSAATTSFCNGSGSTSLLLSGATSGSGITYQWYTASDITGPYSAFGTSDTSSGTGTITSSQYYYATVTCGNSGQSMNSDTILITVLTSGGPTVTITASDDTICRGDTLNLTASGADSYVWSSTNNPNLGNTALIQALPQNTTTYNVVGTDAGGCSSNPVSITIAVGRRPTINALTNSNPEICNGGTSTLTVTAFTSGGGQTTYLWAPGGETSASIQVAPSSSTLYTVTVTGSLGCFRTDTTSIVVNPTLVSPTVTITPDSIGFCSGTASGPITLQAGSSSAVVSYAWSVSAGPPVNSAADTLSVTPGNNTTTYTVSVTDTTNGCVSSASATIYVYPTPNVNATTPNPTVCRNASTVLNAQVNNTQGTPISLYQFSWTPVNASSQLVTINPTETTMYYVTVTSPRGCSTIDSVLVNVDTTLTSPSLTVSPSATSLCSSAIVPVELVATTNATNPTFQWTPNNINQNNDTIVVTPTNSINITVSVTDANGCASYAGATITLTPQPIAGFSAATQTDNSVRFTNSSTDATSYSWEFGDGTSSTDANPSHSYSNGGNYTITLIASNGDGCADTLVQTFDFIPVGITEASLFSSVFPNPTSSFVYIQLNKVQNAQLALFDLSGKLIMIDKLVGTEKSMDIQKLAPGSYVLFIKSDLGSNHIRIVKQ